MRSHHLRLDDETMDVIDRLRGDVPRNTWIKRRLEEAILSERFGMPVQLDPAVEKGMIEIRGK